MAIQLQHRKAHERPRQPVSRPGSRVRYRRLVVPLSPDGTSAQAVATACAIAADADAHVTAVAAIEVPLDTLLEAPDRETEAAAREAIRAAQAIGSTFGIAVDGVVVHARDGAEAIVAEAAQRGAEVIVLSTEWRQGGRVHRLGRTADHVLKHAPCRVVFIGDPAPARAQHRGPEPVFRSRQPRDYWPSGEFVDADGATSR